MSWRRIAIGLLGCAFALAWAPAASAARPKLKLTVKPAAAAPGATVAVSGRVTGRVRGSRGLLRVVLEVKNGARWTRQAAVKPSRRLAFVTRWRVPSAAGVRTLRLRLLRGRRALARSAAWRLTVSAPAAQAPAPAPGPTTAAPSLAPAPGSTTPTPTPTPTSTPDPGGGGGVTPTGQTQVIAPSAVETAPDPGAGGWLRLAGDVAVEAGDVLASGIGDAAPYGFLFKATYVGTEGGDTVVDVEPATLLEAIPEGRIDQNITFAPAPGARRGARARFSEPVTCDGGGTVTIDGTADLGAPQLDLDANWGFLSLNSASAIASVTASASASASASGAASCTVGPVKLFEKMLTPVTFTVGPVPVVLVPKISIELDGLGDVEGAVSTSFAASLAAKAGAKYENGELSPIAELDESFTHVPPRPDGAARLAANLSSELEIAAYGVGGPAFNFNAGLVANADPDADHPWWTLDAPVSFTAGLDVDILDLEAGPITVYQDSFRLAEAAPETMTWSGTVTISEDLRQDGGAIVYDGVFPDPEVEPLYRDDIDGTFTLELAEQPGVTVAAGVEQVEAATTGENITLTRTSYPTTWNDSDPDCTHSRSWEAVAFLDLPGMLEIATSTVNPETGERDRTKGSVVPFFSPEQVDGRGYHFGYDFTEVQGKDDNCDHPYQERNDRYTAVLSPREWGQRAENVGVVKDPEGRIFMKGTVTHDLPEDPQTIDYHWAMMAVGHGTRTVTVDLMGLPPGVPPPPPAGL